MIGYIKNTGVDIMFKVGNEFQDANIARTIRFTEKLFTKLNQVADQEHVSFNLLVLQCCKYALDHLETNSENQE